jgi:hypothetical protein
VVRKLILQDPRYEIQRIHVLVIRNKVAAVVNDDKLKTFVSAIARVSSPTTQRLGVPWSILAPLHTIPLRSLSLPQPHVPSLGLRKSRLEFWRRPKLCNVGHHGYGSILLHELTFAVVFLVEPPPSRVLEYSHAKLCRRELIASSSLEGSL